MGSLDKMHTTVDSLYSSKIISFHNGRMIGCGPQNCMNCNMNVYGEEHYYAQGVWNKRMEKSNWVLCPRCYTIALLAGDFIVRELGPPNARSYEDLVPYQNSEAK